MSIENTPEYQQMLRMRPACDTVISNVFGVETESIERFEKDSDLFILDTKFHIDMVVHMPNGSQITGQEKTLSNKFYKFKTFTIEFYQNRYTKAKGEFFKIASQFYLHGYSDNTGYDFIDWRILNIFKLLNWLKSRSLNDLENTTRPACGSRASFLWIKYDDIPDNIYFSTKQSDSKHSQLTLDMQVKSK